ncbi:MAG: hypothetical protein L6Q95_18230 [Planctomycetes bacterium]|nr:hypothetical protein [Planctomycetota bacterium]
MAADGRRISYDRFWGLLLLLCGALPLRLDGESYPWSLVLRPGLSLPVKAWLAAFPAAGLVALALGLSGARGRGRHLASFVAGTICLALPLALPAVWDAFPEASPRSLPLGDVGSVGWVMLLSLLAIFAGSGMRIVRPAQVPGQAVGALGALLLGIFAFLPSEGSETSFALTRILRFAQWSERWRELLPFTLLAAAAILGTVNLLRSRAEVVLAKLTRALLVAGLLAWLSIPFLEKGGDLAAHLPRAWGALHLLSPLFLALDGAIACVAMTITRSSE